MNKTGQEMAEVRAQMERISERMRILSVRSKEKTAEAKREHDDNG